MTHQAYRILITGSRNWPDAGTVYPVLAASATHANVVVVHGGAPGADSIAGWWVDDHPDLATQEVHPADWKKHGRAAGPIRNQEMVDSGADVCLAFPLGASRGTRDCMRRAAAAGIPVHNFGDPE